MPRIGKEPAREPAFKDGFLSLPTTGMRLAPQILVLELMREIAFASVGGATRTGDAKAMPLDPNGEGSSLVSAAAPARAALFALRGRAKQRKAQGSFYAPAYPAFAAHGWMRRKTDRVVRDFFLKGALASGTAGDEALREKVVTATVKAVYGDSGNRKDVFLLCAGTLETPEGLATPDACKEALRILLQSSPQDWGLEENDVISRRIATDWLSLCRLEEHLPRLAWIEMIGTFLRTVIPLWLLAQMRVCVIVRDFARSAARNELVTASSVRSAINRRHESLLVPSTTLTDSVDDAVVEYMRARVELNVMLEKLAAEKTLSTSEVHLPLAVEPREGFLSLERFGEMLSSVGRSGGLIRDVVLASESYPAWIRPLSDGQGKNIEEFLRVMRNDHVGGQDDGFLLARGPANRRLFRVFPAPKVVALFSLLSHTAKSTRNGRSQRLLLTDLEHAFGDLGIDFTVLGGVRAELLRALANAGILDGTPDAGESTVLSNPYAAALKALEETNP